MRKNTELGDTKYMIAKQKLLIFLYIVRQGCSQRLAATSSESVRILFPGGESSGDEYGLASEQGRHGILRGVQMARQQKFGSHDN